MSTPCPGVFGVSSIYAFYMAYLHDDLDEEISEFEKSAEKAAFFKFGCSHAAFAIFMSPGPSLLFGRFLFRVKNFRQSRAALKTANSIVIRKTSKIWLLQLTAVVTLGLLSLLSLDSRSKNWIESIENERKKQLAEGIAIHPASFCTLPRFYHALHRRTMASRLGPDFS